MPGKKDHPLRKPARDSRRSSVAAPGPAAGGTARRGTWPVGRWSTIHVALGLAAAVALIYAQTSTFAFVNYDDPAYVPRNPHVTHGLNAGDVRWALTAAEASNWHPLTWISHQLDWQIHGTWAGGHHLTNVVLHALSAVVLWVVLRRMTGRHWPAAFAAASFAVHPLRVESVAWVSERKDVLSGLLFLLVLGAYGAYVDCTARSRGGAPRKLGPLAWYLAVVLLFAGGLAAKPMLVSVPCVLLLLDYWPLGRLGTVPLGWLVVEKLPLFALSAASCAMTLRVQVDPLRVNAGLPVMIRLGNALLAYAGYLGQFCYPYDLAVFYPHPGVRLPAWKVLAAAAVLAGISAVVYRWRRRYPYLIVGWLWYLGMLVPAIGLIQVGGQAMADRYTYLPLIGIAIGVAWGAADLIARCSIRPALAGIVAALVLVSLSAQAWLQTGYWQDSATLWRHSLACTRGNYIAHQFLALALAEQGNTAEAIPEFQAALEITPDDGELRCDLAKTLADAGRIDEALAAYEQALRDAPSATAGNGAESATGPRSATSPGRRYAARIQFSMGVALEHAGRTPEAMLRYSQAVRLEPSYPEAHFNLANLLAEAGKQRAAVNEYELAIGHKPDYVRAHLNLAWLLATTDPAAGGDPQQAVALAQRAVALPEADPALALDVLGAAYAAANRFSEAVAAAEKAARAASAAGAEDRAQEIRARLAQYRQNRAYRAPWGRAAGT